MSERSEVYWHWFSVQPPRDEMGKDTPYILDLVQNPLTSLRPGGTVVVAVMKYCEVGERRLHVRDRQGVKDRFYFRLMRRRRIFQIMISEA